METTLELAANVRRAVMGLEVCGVCWNVTEDWKLCAFARDGEEFGPVCCDCLREEGSEIFTIVEPEQKSFYERWAEFMKRENGEE